jgi:multimeric flavodoxin WrbA
LRAGGAWVTVGRDTSSVIKRVIERLYACAALLNDLGEYVYHGRGAGCLITGNDDGVKQCAMNST